MTMSTLIILSMTLGACGGGSSTPASTSTVPPATAASAATVQETTANTTVVPAASTEAVAATVDAAQAVVAAAQLNVTIDCAGGGTALYQASGVSAAELTNGQLNTGENITVTFNACTSAAGAATVSGAMNLAVISATSTELDVNTTTSNVVVSTPRGNVTLNGGSSITRSIVTSGTMTTTTTQWQTPNFSVATAFNSRNRSFDFTNIDWTYSVTTTNGVVSGTSHSGTISLSATLPDGSFSITESTQGSVSFDPSTGLPTSGSWTITLPNNVITVTIANGSATVGIKWDGDSTTDKTYTFTIGTLADSAG
jgi:hypothetical protein